MTWIVKTYVVVSSTPVVVEDPVFASSTVYQPGATFQARENNPSVVQLLADGRIAATGEGDPLEGYIVVEGPVGPVGPTGPGAYNDLEITLGIGNFTGANDIVITGGQKIMGGRACFGSSATAVADGDLSAGDGTRDFSWNSATGALAAGDGTNDLSWSAATSLLQVSGTVDAAAGLVASNAGTGTAAYTTIIASSDVSDLGLYAYGSAHASKAGISELLSVAATSFRVGVTAAVPLELWTSGTHRWSINAAGSLITGADNTHDIGIAAMNRPRTIFVGTSIDIGQTSGSTAVGDIKAGDGTNELAWDASAGLLTVPNLTVNGTTTTIDTVNLTVSDRLILLADGTDPGDEAGVAFERGATGDDSLLLWNEADDRFEFGFFDTVGGTVAPTGALGSLADIVAGNASFTTITGTFDHLNVGSATAAISTGDVAASNGTNGFRYFPSVGQMIFDLSGPATNAAVGPFINVTNATAAYQGRLYHQARTAAGGAAGLGFNWWVSGEDAAGTLRGQSMVRSSWETATAGSPTGQWEVRLGSAGLGPDGANQDALTIRASDWQAKFRGGLSVGASAASIGGEGDIVAGTGDGTGGTSLLDWDAATGIQTLKRDQAATTRINISNLDAGGNAFFVGTSDSGSLLVGSYGSGSGLAGPLVYGFGASLGFYVNNPDSHMIFNISGGANPGSGWQINSENAGRAFRPSHNNAWDIGTTSQRVRTGYFQTSVFVDTRQLGLTGTSMQFGGAIAVMQNLGSELMAKAGTLVTFLARRGSAGSAGTTTIELEINGTPTGDTLSWPNTDANFTLKSTTISQAVALGDRVSFRVTSAETGASDIFAMVV